MSIDTVYQLITDSALQLLDKGIVFWREPWNGPSDSPQNLWAHLKTKQGHRGVYQGVNTFSLHGRRLLRGYNSPWWVTPLQATKLGGKVMESQLYKNGGPGGSLVVYWDMTEKTKADGTTKKNFFLKFTSVYHVDQCEGLDGTIPPEEIVPRVFTPHEMAEQIIVGRPHPAPITHDGGNRAYYRPINHTIHMPHAQCFESATAYYSTLWHEVTHSTGIDLQRYKAGDATFGSDPYAFEELVAEMGATALCAHCGMENQGDFDQSAAYLAGWVSRFKEKRDLLYKAAAAAEKSRKYLLKEISVEEEV